jgi:hypothetical protein
MPPRLARVKARDLSVVSRNDGMWDSKSTGAMSRPGSKIRVVHRS